ncbi:DUF2846 domain-containing protein [Solilutibacter silvestris]|uniref:DUF2846 domain-containing protein n=1 Tax=Solilutibacter silvestris TaxID=1645665 RepID=A0A2K1Q087_9GAMM|nr:DUF2846 domain-containing protein [Lysobacter silvestris]PNS08451.1 hypothetical protein Lysil_0080 [Lysobacter silvestris]
MKRTLAALAVALVCSLITLPVMAQGAIAMPMQQATTTDQAMPVQQAPTTALPAAAQVPTATPAPATAQAPTATPAPATAQAPIATPAPAVASTEPQGLVGPAPADKAQIVFFRPSGMGAAISFKVREGEQELGKLGNRDYFIVTVAPGKHSYVVHSEAKDTLNMEADAGETYYVRGSMSMGFMVGHPHLAQSDKATFDGISSKLSKTN